IYANELNNEEFIHDYSCFLKFNDGELKPGVHYVYTIKVSKNGISVNDSSITDWTPESGFFEGASE
ncbi:MAG: hypothetical protein K2K77_07095, partial [Duncaniella sp.]|nr:hypothetical protein [Duncaniella sp.]